MDCLQPTPTPAFTTSTDTSNITPEQEEKLLEMVQFFKKDLDK